MPLAIILIVPMCLLSAMWGVCLSGGDNNIFTQIVFFVLAGLACKNAILIVEFAHEIEQQGEGTVTAAIKAARLRLRPILMTSVRVHHGGRAVRRMDGGKALAPTTQGAYAAPLLQ